MPLVEHVDPPLDAGQRLDALALEPDQHAGGVLIGAAPHLGRLLVGGVQDLARALLGHAHQLALLEHLGGLLLRARDHRVALLAGAIGDAAGLLGDALGLAHLVGHGGSQLVDQLQHRGLVEHDVVRERQLLACRHEALEPLDEKDDVRGTALLIGADYSPAHARLLSCASHAAGQPRKRASSALRTGGGTISPTSPPNCATSLASVLDR